MSKKSRKQRRNRRKNQQRQNQKPLNQQNVSTSGPSSQCTPSTTTPSTSTIDIAVYGTLKRGESNHGLIRSAKGEFLYEAITVKDEYDITGYGFPIVRKGFINKGSQILCEVFRFESEDVISNIDALSQLLKGNLLKQKCTYKGLTRRFTSLICLVSIHTETPLLNIGPLKKLRQHKKMKNREFLPGFDTKEDVHNHVYENFGRSTPSWFTISGAKKSTYNYDGMPCYGPMGRSLNPRTCLGVFIVAQTSLLHRDEWYLDTIFLPLETSPWSELLKDAFEASGFEDYKDFAKFAKTTGIWIPVSMMKKYSAASLMSFGIGYRQATYPRTLEVKRLQAAYPEVPIMFLWYFSILKQGWGHEHDIMDSMKLEDIPEGLFTGEYRIPTKVDCKFSEMNDTFWATRASWHSKGQPVFRCMAKNPETWAEDLYSTGSYGKKTPENTPWAVVAKEMGIEPEISTDYGRKYFKFNAFERSGLNPQNVWDFYKKNYLKK